MANVRISQLPSPQTAITGTELIPIVQNGQTVQTSINNIFSGVGITSIGLSAPALFTVTNSPLTKNGTLALTYSGTALPIANGGTGLTTIGGIGTVLTSNGTAASWATLPVSTTFSAGTTGFTPTSASSGAVTLAGTLNTSNGGTGLSGATPFTANGVLYASSASALSTGSTLSYTATGLGINSSTPAARLQIGGTALSAAAWTTDGIGLRIDAATFTDTTSSGTIGLQVIHNIGQPTIAASSATTFNNIATLYINNAPAAGTNVTLVNKYALYIGGGDVFVNSNRFVIAGNGNTYPLANFGFPGVGFSIANSTYTSSTTLSGTVYIHSIGTPTLNSTTASQTVTTAATLFIANAPQGTGGNVTITNAYALNIDKGSARIGAALYLGYQTSAMVLPQATGLTGTEALLAIYGGYGVNFPFNSYANGAAICSYGGTYNYFNAPDSATNAVTHYFSGGTFSGNQVNGTQWNTAVNVKIYGVPNATNAFPVSSRATVLEVNGLNAGDWGAFISVNRPVDYALWVEVGQTVLKGGLDITSPSGAYGLGPTVSISGNKSSTQSTLSALVFNISSATYTATGVGSFNTTLTSGSFFGIPTISSASAQTLATVATVNIAGAPVAAGSISFTNAFALNVAGGASRFAGNIVSGVSSIDVVNTTATTVNFAGAATALSIGAATGTLTIGNPTITATNATALNLNGTSPSIVTSSTGTASVFNTNALTGNLFGAATAISIGAATGTITIGNPTITATNATALNLNGASPTLASTSTGTLTLFNTNLTTVNFAGAATTMLIGTASTTNFTIGGGTAAASTINLFAGPTTATINLGTALTTASINVGTAQTTGNIILGNTSSTNGAIQLNSNIAMFQPTPTALTATTNPFTAAQMKTRIITVTSATAVTLTTDTGTNIDAAFTSMATNTAFDFVIVNLGSSAGAVTMAAGTGVTLVGLATVPITTSAQFRMRKTAANTFTLYRIS